MESNQPARAFRIVLTRPGESAAWIRSDLALRLLPFAVAVLAAALLWRPAWLGLSSGWLGVQLAFGIPALTAGFALAALLRSRLARGRDVLQVPAGAAEAALQAAYFALNAPLEEAFFRGLAQGGLRQLAGAPAGFILATAAYVLYHRLGGWAWAEVAATALLGVPLGLAFWLLPGPPSLLGVSLAHAGATCGFLGPGCLLLLRTGALGAPRS